MQIPLINLYARYQAIKYEVAAAFEEVLENMQLFLGSQLQAFRACGIGPGDEVITVANTFIATVEAKAMVGAKPIFVDVGPDTYTMDWWQLDQVLSPRTRALLPIDLYGHAVEMQPVLEFARAHGLRAIEDASQAHDATYYEQRAGSFGYIGCCRLYYSKNLGAYGESRHLRH